MDSLELRSRMIVLAVALGAMAAPALAVNKCVGTDGSVTYTDGPCAGGTTQAKRIETPPRLSYREEMEARRRSERVVEDARALEARQSAERAARERRQEAERAAEREARVAIGLGDADACDLRGVAEFGRAHVGPTAQQLGRHADRDLQRRRGQRPVLAEVDRQVAGRRPEQHRESIGSGDSSRVETRQARTRRLDVGRGLGDVAFDHEPRPESGPQDRKSVV